MDDTSVFRRFFVTMNILRELIGMVTGRDLGATEESTDPSLVNPFIKATEAPIEGNQTVGGDSPPIPGTRPRTPRRRQHRAPQLRNTARYGFPQDKE
jgi:hypothetical protein